LREDSDGGFSYIISSWLIEEGRKPTVMTSYIAAFCPTSLNKNRGVFGGGLLRYFIGIAMLTGLLNHASSGACSMIYLCMPCLSYGLDTLLLWFDYLLMSII
jgi:hypothetical protein